MCSYFSFPIRRSSIAVLIIVSAGVRCAREPVSSGNRSHESATTIATAVPSRGLVLHLNMVKTRVMEGDDVELSEQVANVTNRRIWGNFRTQDIDAEEIALYPPVYGFPAVSKTAPSYPFEMHLQPCPLVPGVHEAPGLPQAVMTTQHFASEIKPGRSAWIVYHFKFCRPGIYRLTATWSSSYSADHQDDLWKGELRSNSVEIIVFPKDL